MTTNSVDSSLGTAARIAGFSYLFIIIGYTLSSTLVYSKLLVAGDVMATAGNIKAHAGLLRIGILCDLVMAFAVIVLIVTHYILLRPVNRNLALFALVLRSVDAFLLAGTAFFSIIALQILAGDASLTAFPPDQLQALGGYFLIIRNAAFAVPTVFHCLGFIVFSYLFLKSNYVPSLLAVFGMLAYVPILVSVLMKLTTLQTGGIIEMMVYVPSLLFETVIGSWLLIKGAAAGQKKRAFRNPPDHGNGMGAVFDTGLNMFPMLPDGIRENHRRQAWINRKNSGTACPKNSINGCSDSNRFTARPSKTRKNTSTRTASSWITLAEQE